MDATFHTRDLTKRLEINVKVEGSHELSIRIFIGILLIKLAVKVMGMGIFVDLKEKENGVKDGFKN